MIQTAATRLFGIDHPVFSAGMARVAQADLVIAVSRAGGLGCLGGVSYMPTQLRQEIRAIRAGTDRPFAVNLLLPDVLTTGEDSQWEPVRRLWDSLDAADRAKLAGVQALLTPGAVHDQVQVVLDERPDAVVLTFATPPEFVEECHSRGIRVMALVGSIGKTREAAASGVDLIVAQGMEGGGHTGHVGTMTLIPSVVDLSPVPVLAAGGISDGRGLAAALALGAAGVWVGTRFIASEEAYAHEIVKQSVVRGHSRDTTLTKAYTGKPLRTLRNKWTEQWESRSNEILPFPAQYAVAGTRVETGYQDGDADYGMMPAGQGIELVHDVLPAGTIVENMVAEARAILDGLARTD
jgi:NAD(P)H-dependent flavin oxidoreductase YrpB (nitropropane dioxygenase family)